MTAKRRATPNRVQTPLPIAPWCDTCHERIIWVGNGWLHVDVKDGWKRISRGHHATGTGWDRGDKP